MAQPLSTNDAIRAAATRLDGNDGDYDALLAQAAGREFVLLGEASHGTHEFYAMRAAITRRLLDEAGFEAIAVEGDWPDVQRLNRHVLGDGDDDLDAAFDDFERFPAWLWRNTEVRDFAAWLRERNLRVGPATAVGIYGMDLYSLYRSAEAVVRYLDARDPGQAAAARRLYAGLDHVQDAQEYGYEAATGLRPDCRDEAATLLRELLHSAPRYERLDGRAAREQQFLAERNASVVMNAERYYRGMFGGRTNTWNLRDGHMVDTLVALRAHLRRQGRQGRVVVWAHNSHLGDARATAMGERGELNVGQLLRQRLGAERVLLVGFTTHTGHVTAARAWDAPPERRWVRPSRPDSWEHRFHRSGLDRFYLPLAAHAGGERLLERAIGVLYLPESERASHYFPADLPAQFDAVFHLDETDALEPIEPGRHWHAREAPETWPSGL